MFNSVPKALYDEAVADRRIADARFAAISADSVPRSAYDALAEQLASVTKEALAMKRHDLSMAPADFDASQSDPMNSLGPKTQLAIDEDAAGDPSIRKYLIGRAHLELAALRATVSDLAEQDTQLARMIREGDRA